MNRNAYHLIGAALLLIALTAFYALTMQTIPNGSSHYYMIDAGETQIILNNWGTLHATGYPLYVITGNIITDIASLFGMDPATSPGFVSLVWTISGLALFGWLILHLTARAELALGAVVLLGLSRTVWLHSGVAEVYAFNLVILAGLLLLAFWRGPIPGRVYWLALLGGIAIGHHRLMVVMIPALVYAAWPVLTANRERLPRVIGTSLLIGLAGLLPYLYLPLRAWAGADWVYGEPGTLSGFIDQFMGEEGQRFVRPPESIAEYLENAGIINATLFNDVTLPGLLVGFAGLIVALRVARYRRPALSMLIAGAAAYIFHSALWWTDPMPALTLPTIIAVVMGWAFLADVILRWWDTKQHPHRLVSIVPGLMIALLVVGLAGGLFSQNRGFVHELTTDPTGLDTIAELQAAPDESVVMLAWGPRYFAAAFAQLFYDDLTHITLVDHQADFAALINDTTLITPEYTFFTQSPAWWTEQIGGDVHLYAAAPGFVQIVAAPRIAGAVPDDVTMTPDAVTVICGDDSLALDVTWQNGAAPHDEDLSVFVHALDAGGAITGQGDMSAPVYGWRPLTTWQPGERIRDIYPINDIEPGAVVGLNYGFYRMTEAGEFENVHAFEINADCA